MMWAELSANLEFRAIRIGTYLLEQILAIRFGYLPIRRYW